MGAAAAGLTSLVGCGGGGADPNAPSPFGALAPDAARRFDLPRGFSYTIVGRTGDAMDDGFLLPGRPDGMATFAARDGTTWVLRNHELGPDLAAESAFGADGAGAAALRADQIYDAGPAGGVPLPGAVTEMAFDTSTQTVLQTTLRLAGTSTNCSGGPTPWGSWITCEENTERAGAKGARDHGYAFEVPAGGGGVVTPLPLVAMGRFHREGVAVDPASGVVFQTEDRSDSALYRFVPDVPGSLAMGGRLQALVPAGSPGADTRNWARSDFRVGEVYDVRWVDLDPRAPDNDLRLRAHALGAAVFARAEGIWRAPDAIYFACTSGGPARDGQIWRYTPSPVEGTPGEASRPGRLTLFVEADGRGSLIQGDNLTATPWGDLFVCEDRPGGARLLGITPGRRIYEFARNVGSLSELAGACFSPDGSTLFVNLQRDGRTLAITGPFPGR